MEANMGTDKKPFPNDKLRRAREERCWWQQDVADKLYELFMEDDPDWTTIITADQIGRWERGVKPSAKYQRKLCVLFEKKPQELGFITEPDAEFGAVEASQSIAFSPSPSQIITPNPLAYSIDAVLSGQGNFVPIDATA